MSLSTPAPRRHLHTRTIACEGYGRDMTVRDIEVATNDAPYDPCFTVAPAYKRLVGAKIGCKAWAADGPVVQRLFPLHYRATPTGKTG